MPESSQSIRLSIVTPVFDTPMRYLAELGDSLRQEISGLDAEWILVDDHSSNAETRAALAELAVDERVRVLANQAGKGAASARNAGAAVAAGDYLYFIDADDVPVPGALRAMLAIVAAAPRMRWLTADFAQFEGDAAAVVAAAATRVASPPAATYQPESAARLVFETLFNQGSYLVDRALFEEVGGFDTRMSIGEDWLLWMRLALRREMYHVDFPAFAQRRGHSSIMSGQLSLTRAIVEPYLLAHADPDFAELRRLLRWRIYRLYCLLAERNRAAGHYRATVRFSMLSAAWGMTDVRQWLNVPRALFGLALR